MTKVEVIKLQAGGYLYPVELTYVGSRIELRFPFSKALLEEVKQMDGAKWHGYDETNPRKMWSINNSGRNRFQLDYLAGKNPYAIYDLPLVTWESKRKLYVHQALMASHAWTRHYCIFSCEMGTGKSLAAIEVAERAGVSTKDCWYVGPRSGVRAFQLELEKWNSKVRPQMYTYEGLVKAMKNWEDGDPAPRFVIFDESSKIKTPTAQRSQCAARLAEAVRKEHGMNGFVILMSGTPAPKSPVDWWNQAETACPGFLKEGNIHKFKARLCVIEERESLSGGVYPHVVTWKDSTEKCGKCGGKPEDECHRIGTTARYHDYVACTDEVSRLYKRLQGLVLVQFKKDCLDLPEKQYRIIKLRPTVDMLRTAQVIKNTSTRAIEALTLLRELSDGFQYTQEAAGEEECSLCLGKKSIIRQVPKEPVPENPTTDKLDAGDFKEESITCPECGGRGKKTKYKRTTDSIVSPKDEAFIDLLDEHDEGGRFIVWGGFTGTIDRLVTIAHSQGWSTLKVDGRGWIGTDKDGNSLDSQELLIAMDYSHPKYKELLEKHPRVCFVGHPQAGGMAITLTASPTELFYSNCFSGEARMQSEDRFHRAGMDTNRGATVIDLILLPTDQLVLDNLKKKKKLQDLSMGELETAFKEIA